MADLHSLSSSSQQHLNMVGVKSINSIPNWLLILKEEKFFTSCLIHDSVKKNEKNIFCLDCCTSICPHCLPLHHPDVLLQIRRYMYSDVIRLGDAERLLNCSLVQPYTTNRAKVLFLKQRPTSHSLRSSSNLCIICDRSLQVQYHLILITKSTAIKDEFSGPLVKERSSDSHQVSQITPDSVLDSLTWKSLCTTISGSTGTSSVQLVPWTFWCTTEIATRVNRRKGVPRRSPLY